MCDEKYIKNCQIFAIFTIWRYNYHMRVTTGKYRGRKLIDNKFEHIRPTADVVKQAIFNKLAFEVPDSLILDLFCGTGALGIEGISRGAKEVVFADKDPRSVTLTKSNLKGLGVSENFKVITGDYKNVIKMLEGKRFDIIILDPPYKSGVYEDTIQKIFDSKLLADDGIIVCEHDKKDKFNFAPFNVVDEKVYGIKEITYLKY